MSKEFNLSEKIIHLKKMEIQSQDREYVAECVAKDSYDLILTKNVKEFIAKIKDDIVENDIYTVDEIFRIINERAGEKLK